MHSAVRMRGAWRGGSCVRRQRPLRRRGARVTLERVAGVRGASARRRCEGSRGPSDPVPVAVAPAPAPCVCRGRPRGVRPALPGAAVSARRTFSGAAVSRGVADSAGGEEHGAVTPLMAGTHGAPWASLTGPRCRTSGRGRPRAGTGAGSRPPRGVLGAAQAPGPGPPGASWGPSRPRLAVAPWTAAAGWVLPRRRRGLSARQARGSCPLYPGGVRVCRWLPVGTD